MAKNKSAMVTVRNLSPGPRDYPMEDGSSIYLMPRGKGANVEIPEVQVSDAMRKAEKKGAISIDSETTAKMEEVSN